MAKKRFCGLVATSTLITAASMIIGCDAGKRTLSTKEDEFNHVLKEELSEANIVDAASLAIAYKVVHEAHKNEASGTEALKKLEALRARAQKRKNHLATEMTAVQGPMLKALTELEFLAIPIAKKVRNREDKYSEHVSVKTGDCFAQDLKSEFHKGPSLERLTIVRVTEKGKEEAMVEEIYSANRGDLQRPELALKKETKSEAKGLFFIENSLKINCETANKMRAKYTEALQLALPVQKVQAQIQKIDSILASEIL